MTPGPRRTRGERVQNTSAAVAAAHVQPAARPVARNTMGRVGEPRRVRRRFPVALAAAVAASAAVAACSGSVRQGQGPAAPAAASPVPPVASAVRVPLTVPAGEGGGALSTRHMLTVASPLDGPGVGAGAGRADGGLDARGGSPGQRA